MALSDQIRLIGPEEKEYIDVFTLLLVRLGTRTVLPELLEVFGRERIIKFLNIFAGTTITVPKREELTGLVTMTDVYITIKNSKRPLREVVGELSDKHQISRGKVLGIYREAKRVVQGLKG